MGYGLLPNDRSSNEIFIIKSIFAVCGVFGYGENDNACEMILRTIYAETQLGDYPDGYISEGHGLCQHDKEEIAELLNRIKRKPDWQDKLKELKIDYRFFIDTETVAYQLDGSPLWSILFCRLSYLKVPVIIPVSIYEQGEYYANHYNKSKPELRGQRAYHYIKSAADDNCRNSWQLLQIMKHTLLKEQQEIQIKGLNESI